MKERPILFSGEMVRAIIDGRKTQTRRVVKPQPSDEFLALTIGEYHRTLVTDDGEIVPSLHEYYGAADENEDYPSPYGRPSDRLWVRETWAKDIGGYLYRVEPRQVRIHCAAGLKWHPSIFMPRAASRLTLEVTEVRVQRVQDITEDDAIAEGIETVSTENLGAWKNYSFETAHPRRGTPIVALKHVLKGFQNPIRSYVSLWDSINAKRGFGWSLNPWVWAITFRNISKP